MSHVSGLESMGISTRPPYELAPGSFIFIVDDALPLPLCEDVVARFERDTDGHYEGRVGQGAWTDTSIKASTDLTVSGNARWRDVDHALFRSLAAAVAGLSHRFPFFTGNFKDIGYAVQRTQPGQHYHWHIDGGSHALSQRQLVAIWYLNDVPGPGGETEFRHQRLSIRPQAGKLALFPPFWTHEHRGVTLEQGVKYIATTWVVFG